LTLIIFATCRVPDTLQKICKLQQEKLSHKPRVRFSKTVKIHILTL